MSSQIGARAGLKLYQVGQPILKTNQSREEQASDINKVFHSLLQKKRKKSRKTLRSRFTLSRAYESRQEARDLWFRNAQNKILLPGLLRENQKFKFMF